MRLLYLLPLLLAPLAATAQKIIYPEPIPCHLVAGQEPASLYVSLKDSSKAKPWRTMKRTEEVRVVGQESPQWAIISGPDANYFIRQRDLAACAGGVTLQEATRQLMAQVSLPIDPTTRLISYSQVVQVPNASKNELYARAKIWFASTFKSAQSVIQADEKEAGVLIGKGWQQVYVRILGTPLSVKLWYTVKLSFKEGKYRYELTNFMFESEPSPSDRTPQPIAAENYTAQVNKKGELTAIARNHVNSLDKAARSTEKSLQASMSQPAAGGDW